MPVISYPDLDDWVHESGRMVVIGEAAHPLPVSAKRGFSTFTSLTTLLARRDPGMRDGRRRWGCAR